MITSVKFDTPTIHIGNCHILFLNFYVVWNIIIHFNNLYIKFKGNKTKFPNSICSFLLLSEDWILCSLNFEQFLCQNREKAGYWISISREFSKLWNEQETRADINGIQNGLTVMIPWILCHILTVTWYRKFIKWNWETEEER